MRKKVERCLKHQESLGTFLFSQRLPIVQQSASIFWDVTIDATAGQAMLRSRMLV